jgi:outer membrane murein-binding lipoprotein Lpp
VLATVLLAGCGDSDQKLRDNAAQTARTAASEVNTTRLVVEQLRAQRLWMQPARRMVDDAEKSLGKTADSFSTQQPSTEQSARLYEQVNSALDDAVSAVTAVRIALGNDDLAAAERQLTALRLSGRDLDQVGELAK